MALQAIYKTRIIPEEAYEKCCKIRVWNVIQDPETWQTIVIFPEGEKAQFSSNRSVNIWAKNLKMLSEIEDRLNNVLKDGVDTEPLGEPVKVMQLGARLAYYTSLEEVEGMLRRIRYPPDVQPHEFKDFVKCVFGTYCEGEDIVILDLAQITGLDEEKVERYLDFMTKLNFTHMKPPKRRLEKVYYIGCTPKEESDARVKSVGGKIAARGYFRRSRIFENFRIIILEREPLLKIREEKPLLRIFLERVASLNDRPLL